MRLIETTFLVFLLATTFSLRAQMTGFTGTVTNKAFSSPNARFQLSIEETWNPKTPPDAREMVATMQRIENGRAVSLWKSKFKSQPTRFWRKSDVIVSDTGSFALVPERYMQWTLLKDGKALQLSEKMGGSARQSGEKILEVDDNAVVRIWNRETEKWTSFSLETETVINSNPKLIQVWNETTRQNILRKIRRAEAENFSKRFGAIAKNLPEAARAAIPQTAPGDLRATFLEFLALQGNPEDRLWFEKLLRADSISVAPNIVQIVTPRIRHGQPGDPYMFIETNERQVFADFLLAIFEGKLEDRSQYWKRPAKPVYLGKVSGRVRLPAPILSNAGFIRIHLVPQERAHKNWIERQTVSIDDELLFTTFEQFDLSDEISFSFQTVPPGKYLAKAIWDKRRPFSDVAAAGAGDYQSEWVGPIEIKAGDEISDVFIDCDQPAAAGQEYYSADRLAIHQWRNTGALTLFSHAHFTDGRREIVSAPFASWVVQTNFLKPGKSVEFTRLAMFASGSDNSRTAPLTILWRHGVTPNGRPASDPMQICILDKHGCQFVPDQIRTTLRTEVATFPILPRSEETWRLVGYGPTGENDLLFDFTIKNPVRREPSAVAAQTFPLDLDLSVDFETLRMRITRARVLPKSVMLEAAFFQNGIPTTDWTIGDVTCLDADGNAISPTEGCRQKTTLHLTSAIHHKTDQNKKPIPFELTISAR